MMLHPKWKQTLRIPDSALRALSVRLAEKRTDIIEKRSRADWVHHQYAPLFMPFEKTGLDTVARLRETLGEPKLVILIGIGGSSLGPEAVLHALSLQHRVMVFDTLVPERIGVLESRLVEEEFTKEEIVVVIISKSGKTAETDANATAVLSLLESKYGDCRERIVAISDEGTPLEARARENGWRYCAIPKAVGGRYSVFTLVGLVPLGLAGVDIERLLLGAREALLSYWKTPLLHDPSSSLAALSYLMHEKGFHQEINFYFSPNLEMLGKWHRQLMAESTGKMTDTGKRVGILPHIAVGTTDLHSIEQYIIDGPRDLYIILHSITSEVEFSAPVYQGKTIAELRDVILRGLQSAYQSEGVPYCHLDVGPVNEKTIGAYMATRMESVILLSHLLGIDPFNQPGVESYKTHTRALLGKEKTE
jgi:glucose-6-phosphate isomerase